MPSAENIKPDSRSLNLFVGRSGSGKSAAAYSFPHPLEVLDLDGRIRGGLVPWVVRKDLDYTYYPSKPAKGTTFEALNNKFEAIQVLARQGQYPYKTLVLDSATWFANDMLIDAMPLTHVSGGGDGERGRKIGSMNVAGPDDYKFQSTAVIQMLAFLKTLPIPHIIVTAHIVNRWGKRRDPNGKIIDPYGPSEVIGEQLVLTDKIAETLPSTFDNVFRFEKVDNGSKVLHKFSAQGEMERSTYNLPYGQIDITGKSFYDFLMTKIQVQTPTPTAAGVGADFAKQ